jgi:ABC-type lipoprotein export system ATPase subunit
MAVAELINIIKSYPQPEGVPSIRVLDDISLQINPSDTVAITGPSGSGKTTLLNILGTLDKPTSGTILLDGREVNTLSQNQLAEIRNRFIGFVFQQHHLLPQLSVIENVLLPLLPVKEKLFRKAAGERALEMLEIVGLQHHVNRFPGNMSVGECQRVAVVRALINQPKLLLADEPTGSLDAGNAEILVDMITKLQAAQGFSMVMVTHDPAVASKMNTHFRLTNGNIQ